MLPTMQTLEQVAIVVLDMLLCPLEFYAANVPAVCLLNLCGKPLVLQSRPIIVTHKRTVVVAVRKPVFLLPTAVSGSSVNKLVQFCGVAYLVNALRILKSAVKFFRRRSA